jgi:hypothetical protein
MNVMFIFQSFCGSIVPERLKDVLPVSKSMLIARVKHYMRFTFCYQENIKVDSSNSRNKINVPTEALSRSPHNSDIVIIGNTLANAAVEHYIHFIVRPAKSRPAFNS